MWASIEKWAYPEWSFPLFVQHPDMTLGFDPDFFMRAAGAVEFALAFALMWTPLVRRVGAIMLAAMFISAVFEFGKIDLIGHTLIVVVLVRRSSPTIAPRSRSWCAIRGWCRSAYASALARIPGGLLRDARLAVRHVAHVAGSASYLT